MRLMMVICLLILLAPIAARAEEPAAQPLAFEDFHCTKDCSGHIAGFKWAAKKHITAENQCGGKSNSFIEGCIAWVRSQHAQEEQQQEPSPARPNSPAGTE